MISATRVRPSLTRMKRHGVGVFPRAPPVVSRPPAGEQLK
jgi:hypothetical protein